LPAPPDLSALPTRFAFAERCTFAADACRQTRPALRQLAADHGTRCLRTDATANAAHAATALFFAH